MNLNKIKFVTFLIIASLAFSPFGLLPVYQAKAQFGPNQGVLSGTSFSTKGIGVLAMQVPGCRKAIGEQITNLFAALGSDTAKAKQEATKQGKSLPGESTSAAWEASSVPIAIDPIIRKNIFETKTNTDQTQKDTTELKKEKCFNALGHAVVKGLIQKLTFATVNWINSGYSSYGNSSFFVENPGSFFRELAKEQILSFNFNLNDPAKYPFAKTFMSNTISSFKSSFEKDSEFTLDKMIETTNPGSKADDFYNDFSKGGWNAWLGMTQFPQNNPVGFNITAANTLANRINNSENEIRESLKQSSLLSDQRCADPEGTSRLDHMEALADPASGKQICKRWETVTPGSIIAEQIKFSSTSPLRQHELADDLGQSLGIIMDAALHQFLTNLSSKGLAKIEEPGGYQIYDLSSLGVQAPTIAFVEQYAPQYVNNDWFVENPYFDVRYDLTQSFIDTQKIYAEKLEEQNTELQKLITTIYQLDYCIPGPHPGWENEAYRNLQNHFKSLEGIDDESKAKDVAKHLMATFKSIFPSINPPDDVTLNTGAFLSTTLSMTAMGAVVGSAFPGPGTAIGAGIGAGVGITIGLIQNLKTNRPIPALQKYIMIMTQIFERYKQSIVYIYNDKTLAGLPVKEARDEFNKISGYQQIIETNGTKISDTRNAVRQLEILQKVTNKEKTMPDFNNEYFDPEDPDRNSWLIKKFAPLTVSLVDGDDIENEANFYDQIKEKKAHILNDLVIGAETHDGSCEKNKQFLDWHIQEARNAYPLPRLHDYSEAPIDQYIIVGIPKVCKDAPKPYDNPYECEKSQWPSWGIGKYIDNGSNPWKFRTPLELTGLTDNYRDGSYNAACGGTTKVVLLDDLYAPTFIDTSYLLGIDERCGGNGQMNLADIFGKNILKIW